MYLNVWFLGFIFMMGDIYTEGRTTTDTYLGPASSKAFHFPWLVTFHWMKLVQKDGIFFGSGSILTPSWVLASMDCFIVRRRARGGDQDPFYLDLERIQVIAGDIWAQPFTLQNRDLPRWLQVRLIDKIRMFSDPDKKKGLTFTKYVIPDELNLLKKSPFGFSMSIALVKVKNFEGSPDTFEWKKAVLPIPLYFGRGESGDVEDTLRKELELLEQQPFGLRCHVGGWRVGDRRLVQYEVVYVPFEMCESIYCAYDDRFCLEWPIKGIHACFKSLTFTDLCWRDQGSALYCEQISESIIAILTTAPTCGYNGLPGVYTLINNGLELLESTTVSRSEWYKPIPKQELLRQYGPPKENYLLPAYD